MICVECQFVNRDGVRFCTRCGTQLYFMCLQCNTPAQAADACCGSCGVQLSPATKKLPVLALAPSATNTTPATQNAVDAQDSERRNVTVLFADISGFTAMSEKLDPEVVTSLMNGCMRNLADIVTRYEGHVDKFIGDCIMAIFGAPIAHENDPELALRAALDMMKSMEEYNKTLPVQLETPLALHTGINTGMVIAGGMGTDQKMQYTVMGDTVNLASRMESLAVSGETLVSSYTYNLTRHAFDFVAMDPVKVKGKKDPVAVYRVIKPKAVTASDTKPSENLPLVGREQEIKIVGDAYTRFRKGMGQAVFLISEPGVGKSRLQTECNKQFHENDIQTVSGACRSYSSCSSYSIFIELFHNLFGVNSDDVAMAAAHKVASGLPLVLGLNPETLPTEAKEAIVFIAFMLGGNLSGEFDIPLKDMPAQEIKIATFRAISWLFERMAHKKPLSITLEDLHYADAASIELIAHLFRVVGKSNILLILLLRPNKDHASARLQPIARKLLEDACIEVAFRHLDNKESDQLSRLLLHSEKVPEQLLRLIRERAVGNPLYIEEIVRSLRDDRVVEKTDAGEIRILRNLGEVSIPNSLSGMITARVDRLPAHLKELLNVAAVIGSTFRLELLRRVANIPNLDALLDTLTQEEILFESQSFPEIEYSFRNVLIQESVYGAMLLKKRKALHLQVAQQVERLFANNLEEQAELLGYHFHLAEEWKPAYVHLVASGLKAKRAFANEEAVRAFSRALTAAPFADAAQMSVTDLHVHLSETKELMGEMSEAIVHREEAIKTTTDAKLQADFLRNIGRMYEKRGFKDDAARVYEQAFVLLADHVDSLEMGQLFMNQSWVLNRSREFAPAMEKANAALEIFKAHNSRENIALVYNNLAVFCEHQNDLDKALDYNQRSLQLFTELNDKRQMANLYLSMGYVHNSRKEFELALEYFSKSVTLMERIGNRYGAGTALMSKGRIYMDTNRLDLAARELHHSLRIHQELDLKKKIVANELALAKLYLMKQDWDSARQHLAVAHSEAQALNYESDLAKIFLLEAQILSAAGEDPQAAFAHAIELFQKLKRNRDADQAAAELAAWKSR